LGVIQRGGQQFAEGASGLCWGFPTPPSTRNLGYVSIGLLLALIGSVVEFLGFVQERWTVAASEPVEPA